MFSNPSLKLGSFLTALVVIVSTLPACTSGSASGSSALVAKDIRIDGSSTVHPISNAIAQEYTRTTSQAKIDVKFSGTSAGFNKFCAGETEISNASRPILLQEVQVCANNGVAFIELPIAFDALTIAVNPKNTWATDITVEELAKIWSPQAEGEIKSWRQVRSDYPDQPLKLYGAGSDSGTYDYFNEVTTGNPDGSRSDYTGSEDDNVIATGIKQDPNALGYLPFAYYEAHQQELKALPVNGGKGAVLPSRQAVEKSQYQPFSRPLFIYVNAKAAQENPALKAFVEYYLTNARRVSTTVGYIPLPAEAYRLANLQFTRGEIGTVFEGVPQPNVTISELLRRQAVFQLSDSQPSEAQK